MYRNEKINLLLLPESDFERSAIMECTGARRAMCWRLRAARMSVCLYCVCWCSQQKNVFFFAFCAMLLCCVAIPTDTLGNAYVIRTRTRRSANTNGSTNLKIGCAYSSYATVCARGRSGLFFQHSMCICIIFFSLIFCSDRRWFVQICRKKNSRASQLPTLDKEHRLEANLIRPSVGCVCVRVCGCTDARKSSKSCTTCSGLEDLLCSSKQDNMFFFLPSLPHSCLSDLGHKQEKRVANYIHISHNLGATDDRSVSHSKMNANRILLGRLHFIL